MASTPYHATGAVNDSEILTEQFLTPLVEKRLRAIIIEQSAKRIAVSDPVEVATPEISTILTDSKLTGASFASHRMVMGFRPSSAARTKSTGSLRLRSKSHNALSPSPNASRAA